MTLSAPLDPPMGERRDGSSKHLADEDVADFPDLPDPDQATRIGERVVRCLRAPFFTDDRPILLSASVGLAVASNPEQPIATLLGDADQAVFRAELRGGGCLEMCDLDGRLPPPDPEGDLFSGLRVLADEFGQDEQRDRRSLAQRRRLGVDLARSTRRPQPPPPPSRTDPARQ